jgi:hypothetical protein
MGKIKIPNYSKYILIFLTFIFPLFTFGYLSRLFAIPQIKIGKIIFVRGHVDIINLELKTHHTAKLDEIIYKTDEIRTSTNSRVDILLHNGEEISIYSRSIVNIYESMTGQRVKKTVRVLTGKVRVHIPLKLRGKETFSVKTPTMLATVKGTDFGVIASLVEARVVVFNGQLVATNRSRLIARAVQLGPKNEIRIFKGKEPDMPRVLSSSVLRNWFDIYYINWEGIISRKIRERETIFDYLIKKRNVR